METKKLSSQIDFRKKIESETETTKCFAQTIKSEMVTTELSKSIDIWREVSPVKKLTTKHEASRASASDAFQSQQEAAFENLCL